MRQDLPKWLNSPPRTGFAFIAIGCVLLVALASPNVSFKETADFLYRWQTLIAGILALVGAAATIWQMRAGATADERAALDTFERLITDMLKNLEVAWLALDHGEGEAVITGMPLSSFDMVWKDIESKIPWHLIRQSAKTNRFYARVRCMELIEQVSKFITDINMTRRKGSWNDLQKVISIRTYFSHIDQAAKNFNPALGAIFSKRTKNKVDWTPYRDTVAQFLADFKPPESLISRMRAERKKTGE